MKHHFASKHGLCIQVISDLNVSMYAVDDAGHKTESAPISRMSGDAVVIDGDGYTIRVKISGKMEMSDDGSRCVN